MNVFLKKIVECPSEYSDVVIDQFLSVINEHPVLISPQDLINENKTLSLFAFCLKEIHQLLLTEQKKREEIILIKNKIARLEHLIYIHHNK